MKFTISSVRQNFPKFFGSQTCMYYRCHKTRRLSKDLNCFFLDIWHEWRKKEPLKDFWHEYDELEARNNIQWFVCLDRVRTY